MRYPFTTLAVEKWIQHCDAKRLKMAKVFGQDRQPVLHGRGGDGNISEAGRKPGGSRFSGKLPRRAGGVELQGKNPVAVKSEHCIERG